MFGSVRPFLGKLSEEDRNTYAAYYCGLCETLHRRYGLISRFLLNYDMVFVALCKDDLSGTQFTVKNRGCIANPFKKKDILDATPGLDYAADVLVMLSYFKAMDNISDEKGAKRLGYILSKPFLHMKYRSAARKWPMLRQVIEKESMSQKAFEDAGADLDSVAMPTENMTRAIMESCTEDEEMLGRLGRFGFFLGRVIYLLDALEDMEEDRSRDRYNYFIKAGKSADEAREDCYMALGELAFWYDRLGMRQHSPILDNIIYMGLYRDIRLVNSQKEEEDGREIQSAGAGTRSE